MISTSIILCTGEKKWMPTKFSGRPLASASPLIGSVEVLVAKIASSPSTASAFFVVSALTPASSNTASITRSHPASAA